MVELPDRTLPGADEGYRLARVALLHAETQLREQNEHVAAMRRGLPP